MSHEGIERLLALDTQWHPETSDTELLASHITPHFREFASLWQRGDYDAIVHTYHTLPEIFSLDIRICIYYLYASWVTTPTKAPLVTCVKALQTLLEHPELPWCLCLDDSNNNHNSNNHNNNDYNNSNCNNNNHSKINHHNSENNQSAQLPYKDTVATIFQNSLNLFFKKVLARLTRHQSQNHAIPGTTANNRAAEEVEATLTALAELKALLNARYEHLNDELYVFISQITDHYQWFKENACESEDFDAAQQDSFPPTHSAGNEPMYSPANAADNAGDNGVYSTSSNTPVIDKRLSYPLKKLLQKIHLLDVLLEKNESLKAAIVLEDIQSKLDDFDPLHYFPDLFTDFTSVRAHCAQSLEPYFCHRDSYHWKVLKECLYTNPQAFINVSPGLHSCDHEEQQCDHLAYHTADNPFKHKVTPSGDRNIDYGYSPDNTTANPLFGEEDD